MNCFSLFYLLAIGQNEPWMVTSASQLLLLHKMFKNRHGKIFVPNTDKYTYGFKTLANWHGGGDSGVCVCARVYVYSW